MKIHNFQHNPNFGYDAQFHKKFQDNIAKRKTDKEIAERLIQLDKISLAVEDEIVAMEENKRINCLKNGKYQKLTEFLCEIKNVIGYFSALSFPMEKYCDNVIKQYHSEQIQKEDLNISNWRLSACEALSAYSVKYLDREFLPKKKAPSIQDVYEQEANRNEEEANARALENARSMAGNILGGIISKVQNNTDEKLITKYIPTASSPKGFCDVVGLDSLKEEFNNEIIEYINFPEMLVQDKVEYGINPPRGYLLWGPPGCGKTYIAQALAQESGMDMYRLDVSKVGSKYVNQSAVNIEEAFQVLTAKAQESDKPILLFMDEVDSLVRDRNSLSGDSSEDVKVVTTLLKHVEAAKDNNIIIFAATNKYDLLDEAFVSRFDDQKYIGLPDKEQIVALMVKHFSATEKGKNLSIDSEALEVLAQDLIGYSNRSIVFILEDAAKKAKKDSRSDIMPHHVKQAIKECEFDKIDESKYQKNKKKFNLGFRKND